MTYDHIVKKYGQGYDVNKAASYSELQVIDKINPSHYTYGAVETIDFIKSCGFAIDFCAGNVLKYVSRYKHKNGIEDIKKAQWYVNKMLELLEEVDSGDS